MKNMLFALCAALFTLISACKEEQFELGSNILDDPNYMPFVFDSVDVGPVFNNSRQFTVYFKPNLDSLSQQQRDQINEFVWFENGEERAVLELNRRWFHYGYKPVGTNFRFELALRTKIGEDSRRVSFDFTVP